LNSEASVIGCILLDSSKVMAICHRTRLEPKHFKDTVCGLVYRISLEMSKGHEAIDLLTMHNELNRRSLLESIGGFKFLSKCVDDVPTVEHAGSYIQGLIDQRHSEEAEKSLISCIENVRTSGQPVQSLISSAVTDLTRLLMDSSGEETNEDIDNALLQEYRLASSGTRVGIESAWMPLGRVLGTYSPSELIIIAGRPSDGKTTLALNEILHSASRGIPCALASIEMSARQIRARLAGAHARVSIFKMRMGQGSEEEHDRLKEAFEDIRRMPIYINDSVNTLGQVSAWMSQEKFAHGIEMGVVDYLQLMTSDDKHKSRVEVVGEWSQGYKNLSKKLKIPMLVLSQLSRSGHRNQDESPPPPTLEALRDSGSIEQDADIVMFVYKKPGLQCDVVFNHDKSWPMEISVSKNRNGPTGAVEMTFVRHIQQYMSQNEYSSFSLGEQYAA